VIASIVRRELLGSGRQGRWFLVRVAHLVLLAAVAIPAVLSQAKGMAGNPRGWHAGTTWVVSFGTVQLALIALTAPALAAGALSSERASRVVELLDAAGVPARDRVLGKVAARLATLTLYAAAGVPLLAVATLMGGAGAELIALLFCHAVAAAFVGTAIGVTVSGATRNGVAALTASYGFLALHYALPLVIDGGIFGTRASPTGPLPLWCPPIAIASAAEGAIPMGVGWLSLISQVLLGCLYLLPAFAFAGGREDGARRVNDAGVAALDGRRKLPRRAIVVGDNPVAWREAHASRRSLALRLFRLAFLGIGGAISVHATAFAVIGGWQGLARYTLLVFLLAGAGVAMIVASAAVTAERELGTLPLLRLSRLTGGDIWYGKAMGVWRFLWPVFAVCLFPAVAFVGLDGAAALLAACAAAVFFFAATAFGLLCSSVCRRTSAAMGMTVAGALGWVFLTPIVADWLIPARSIPLLTLVNPGVSLLGIVESFGFGKTSYFGLDPALAIDGLLVLFGFGAFCALASAMMLDGRARPLREAWA
jgi:hypothetical protein